MGSRDPPGRVSEWQEPTREDSTSRGARERGGNDLASARPSHSPASAMNYGVHYSRDTFLHRGHEGSAVSVTVPSASRLRRVNASHSASLATSAAWGTLSRGGA